MPVHPPGTVGILWSQPDSQASATIGLPEKATPEMKEYFQIQETLKDKINLLPKINGALDPQAFALFQQQNLYLLKRQNELMKIVARQQAQNPLPMPPALQLSPDASPALRAFLITRDQLMRDQVTWMNQHRNDDSATRQAALEKWQQENAPRFQQLQHDAQALSPETASATSAQGRAPSSSTGSP